MKLGAGNIVGDEPCPTCRKNGGDKTGNHLIIFKDGGKKCTKCGYSVVVEAPQYTVEEVNSWEPEEITYRGITRETCEHFNVKVSCEEAMTVGYPVHGGGKLGYKLRHKPKKFVNIGNLKGIPKEFFGQRLAEGSKVLLITAGEQDALAAFQMLKDKYPTMSLDVVSVASGESMAEFEHNMEFINSHESVLLCFDDDVAGNKLTNKAMKLLGSKAYRMTMPDDPNKMLLEGNQAQFISTYFNKGMTKPEGVYKASEMMEEILAPVTYGDDFPFPSMTEALRGSRDGDLIGLISSAKSGKTSFMNKYITHFAANYGQKTLVCAFEATPPISFRSIAGAYSGHNFLDPKFAHTYSSKDLQEAALAISDYVTVYKPAVSRLNKGDTVFTNLEEVIRYAVLIEGVKHIIIDPALGLSVGMDASQRETELRRAIPILADLLRDTGTRCIITSHVKLKDGKDPNEGADINVGDIFGSRALLESATSIIALQRNKKAESELERRLARYTVLENRLGDVRKEWFVEYQQDSGKYEELQQEELRL